MSDEEQIIKLREFSFHAGHVINQLVAQLAGVQTKLHEADVREAERRGQDRAQARLMGIVGGLIGTVIAHLAIAYLKPKVGLP